MKNLGTSPHPRPVRWHKPLVEIWDYIFFGYYKEEGSRGHYHE